MEVAWRWPGLGHPVTGIGRRNPRMSPTSWSGTAMATMWLGQQTRVRVPNAPPTVAGPVRGGIRQLDDPDG
jgi:hypothetical protein